MNLYYSCIYMNRNCNLVTLEKILISFHTSIRMLNFATLFWLNYTLHQNLIYITLRNCIFVILQKILNYFLCFCKTLYSYCSLTTMIYTTYFVSCQSQCRLVAAKTFFQFFLIISIWKIFVILTEFPWQDQLKH